MSIDKDGRPDRARKLHSEGIEIVVIAERLDVTRRTVWRWINREKIEVSRRLELPSL